MDRRHFLLMSLSLTAFQVQATARAASALNAVPDAKVVGRGRLSVLMMPVFDATLYAPGGQWQSDRPYALKLDYLMPLQGAGMARHATDEMRTTGVRDEALLRAWQLELSGILPDVTKGDSLIAVRNEAGGTQFYKGDNKIGYVGDSRFGDALFSICLSPKTSRPELRQKLLGHV